MKEFEMPKFVVNKTYEDQSRGHFVIEPFERGLGNTIGNSLRRVLLSLLPGSAIFAVQIEGAEHEFCALKGVVDDVPQIILNLKKIVLKIDSSEDDAIRNLKIDVVGPKVVTAADIEVPGDVEIINKDEYIATVSEKGHLVITMQANKGRGFVLAEVNKQQHNMAIGTIPVDSNYSPVNKVSVEVTSTRVGNSSNYDRLDMEVVTDGSMKPAEALSLAGKILEVHFKLFENTAEVSETIGLHSSRDDDENNKKNEDLPIEELDLSVRSYNCLKRAAITTVNELCSKTEEEMMKFRNLGKKSLKEVKEKLEKLGRSFKQK